MTKPSGVGTGLGAGDGTVLMVGAGDGEDVGLELGKCVGTGIGDGVGAGLGSGVGAGNGTRVGMGVGAGLGNGVGAGNGTIVGAAVEQMHPAQSHAYVLSMCSQVLVLSESSQYSHVEPRHVLRHCCVGSKLGPGVGSGVAHPAHPAQSQEYALSMCSQVNVLSESNQ